MDRNEAIKVVKSHYPANKQMLNEALEFLIPELKESEGEAIRKALIKYYSFDKDGGSHALDNITPKQIVTWLEKQGEQNPTDKIELKFKVGDVVRSSNGASLLIVGITDYCYNCVTCATNDEYSFGFDIQDEFELVEDKKEWSEEDDSRLKEVLYYIEYINRTNVTFQQRDLTRLISWLKSLKERVGCGVNCITTKEWSEEDKSMLNDIMHNIHFAETHRNVTGSSAMEKEQVNWLKSLRPQTSWKPSEEQMHALFEAHKQMSADYHMPLLSLYNDLNKL